LEFPLVDPWMDILTFASCVDLDEQKGEEIV
jgi:hypothetical protein